MDLVHQDLLILMISVDSPFDIFKETSKQPTPDFQLSGVGLLPSIHLTTILEPTI